MNNAGVAQLVERVIGNDEVHGSDSHHQLQNGKKLDVKSSFLFIFSLILHVDFILCIIFLRIFREINTV